MLIKPFQGLRVSPSWACGGTGGARDGRSPQALICVYNLFFLDFFTFALCTLHFSLFMVLSPPLVQIPHTNEKNSRCKHRYANQQPNPRELTSFTASSTRFTLSYAAFHQPSGNRFASACTYRSFSIAKKGD